MTNVFRSHIRTSLADANLQAALDGNAERRITVRQKAFASLTDPQGMRQRAHAIRADVVSNLEQYLEQFIARVKANGIIVHRASQAAQAVQTVLEIAGQGSGQAGKPSLIAKSKTMVSEEIGLNHTLEAAGLRVVETDLGEFIVQIRHEPPSHIITPAVHLSRADVGKTFHEVLGIPFTDDIPTLTTVARRTLRDVFLTADVGLSGVNFGVAETGTLCVVTNEGNGRMVTTVPRVHIALMGMERLVPTMDDLALMLALLPRSATGQKLSVYTSLLHSPRRAGDRDGPRERHLIILDNGRGAVSQSPLAEILYCIRCGACLNACPVFREIGGHSYVGKDGRYAVYPGPMGSVVTPALFGGEQFGHLARASSLCGACREACPVDIDLPRLLLRVRAGQIEAKEKIAAKPNPPPTLALGLKLFTWAAASTWRFELAQQLAGWLGGLGSFLMPSRGAGKGSWLRLPAFTGWGYSKDFPRPARKPFRKRFKVSPSRGLSRVPEQAVESHPPEQSSPIQTRQTLLETFATELSELGGLLITCREEELAEKILSLMQERSLDALLAWEETRLPSGLLPKLKRAGIHVQHPSGETKGSDATIRAGLTGALAAVAGTGTLVLVGGAGQPLTASLLPELHIALLRQADIYEDLSAVFQLRELREASAAVLVSGPSRTADIEMTLTIGVHGPGELIVLCY